MRSTRLSAVHRGAANLCQEQYKRALPLAQVQNSDTVADGVECAIESDPHAANVDSQAKDLGLDPLPVPSSRIVAGRYRLSTLLGTGGMGAVWLAHDEVLRRAVALKQVRNTQPENESSVLGEARAAARVTHPGVVRVHDVLVGEDGEWIVMEALGGNPLSTILATRGRLPVDEVVRIALQLLSALQAIHDADLVHRDVKPGNVQICDGDRVVLTDFGLSSPRGVWGGLRVAPVQGSLPYLAPESIIDGSFGPPSDLYALGVTLYRAVEGQRPFDPGTPFTVLESLRSRALKPARHAGPLREVLGGLLENDPSRRLDAGGARSQLEAIEALATMARAG
jgi:eukaryotic-like serine/threonine-protein kinase